MRFRKPFLGIVLCLLITSCTSKVALRFLDWQIVWWVEDYVSWDVSQQVEFDARLKQQLDWHKKTQLPVYGQYLRQLKSDLDQPVSEPLLRKHMEAMRLMWGTTLNHVADDVVFMLSDLDDEQIEDIVNHLHETIEESEEDYFDSNPQKRLKGKIKRTQKMAKRFVGRLNKEQITLITEWSEGTADNQLAWLENRKKWTVSLHDALRSRQNVGFEEKIKQLFVNSEYLWDEADRQRSAENYTAGVELTISLFNTLTVKQHRHVRETLDDWIETFEEFSET